MFWVCFLLLNVKLFFLMVYILPEQASCSSCFLWLSLLLMLARGSSIAWCSPGPGSSLQQLDKKGNYSWPPFQMILLMG